ATVTPQARQPRDPAQPKHPWTPRICQHPRMADVVNVEGAAMPSAPAPAAPGAATAAATSTASPSMLHSNLEHILSDHPAAQQFGNAITNDSGNGGTAALEKPGFLHNLLRKRKREPGHDVEHEVDLELQDGENAPAHDGTRTRTRTRDRFRSRSRKRTRERSTSRTAVLRSIPRRIADAWVVGHGFGEPVAAGAGSAGLPPEALKDSWGLLLAKKLGHLLGWYRDPQAESGPALDAQQPALPGALQDESAPLSDTTMVEAPAVRLIDRPSDAEDQPQSPQQQPQQPFATCELPVATQTEALINAACEQTAGHEGINTGRETSASVRSTKAMAPSSGVVTAAAAVMPVTGHPRTGSAAAPAVESIEEASKEGSTSPEMTVPVAQVDGAAPDGGGASKLPTDGKAVESSVKD
ncbi:hypothetical protein KEM52_000242, partial [Ascosphaera acerosa]